MKTRNALPKKSLKWERPEKISIQVNTVYCPHVEIVVTETNKMFVAVRTLCNLICCKKE